MGPCWVVGANSAEPADAVVVDVADLAAVIDLAIEPALFGALVAVAVALLAIDHQADRHLAADAERAALAWGRHIAAKVPDIEFVFAGDLAPKAKGENPVWRVQSAPGRICSVLAAWGGDVASPKAADLTPLDSPAAQALMLLLAKYPAMLADAARDFAPHDVTFYLRELAASYHSYYDAERILVDDERVKTARLALVAATAQVLHNGLAVLGVSAPQKM